MQTIGRTGLIYFKGSFTKGSRLYRVTLAEIKKGYDKGAIRTRS